MFKCNRENVLSYFLAFVFFYFGYQEIVSTDKWVALVPDMFANIVPATSLVMMHGIALVLVGLALVFNYYRRVASMVAVLMLLDIVVVLLGGFNPMNWSLNPVAARDIGLLGVAIALSVKE